MPTSSAPPSAGPPRAAPLALFQQNRSNQADRPRSTEGLLLPRQASKAACPLPAAGGGSAPFSVICWKRPASWKRTKRTQPWLTEVGGKRTLRASRPGVLAENGTRRYAGGCTASARGGSPGTGWDEQPRAEQAARTRELPPTPPARASRRPSRSAPSRRRGPRGTAGSMGPSSVLDGRSTEAPTREGGSGRTPLPAGAVTPTRAVGR